MDNLLQHHTIVVHRPNYFLAEYSGTLCCPVCCLQSNRDCTVFEVVLKQTNEKERQALTNKVAIL